MRKWLPLLLLAGCCARAVAIPEPPPPAAPPDTGGVHQSAETVAVVRHFDEAQVRELTVVIAPGITRQQIEAVTAADRRARHALTKLGREIHRPPKGGIAPALKEARLAVTALELALQMQ